MNTEQTSIPQFKRAKNICDLEPGPRYQALIFDWDGTLADSHTANYEAFAQTMRVRGIEINRSWFNARTGLSTADMAAAAAQPYGTLLNMENLKRERDAAYLELLPTVRPIVEVVQVLKQHRSRLKTAIASGGQAVTLLPTARAIGLDSLVDVIVTLDDVKAGKPSPDVFLRAAKELGVNPGSCLVYEDSNEGLAAAQAAGMDAIDVRDITAS